MNVHLCVCIKVSPHAYVCMHECVRAIKEYPQRSGKVSFSLAFWPFSLVCRTTQFATTTSKDSDFVRLCLASVLFRFGPEVTSSK